MSTRPSRNAPAPRPLANTVYCHTCGRVISPRKSHATQPTPQKYCSDRCRRERPRPGSSTESEIVMPFVRLLGDAREKVVTCGEVEREVFMDRRHIEESGEITRPLYADEQGKEEGSGDEEGPEDEDGGVRLPCHMDHLTASATLKPKLEAKPHKTPSEWGMQKAKEREMVRRAARKGVAFGFEVEAGRRRSVVAVQGERVVESSFAKGEWGVRWRE